MKKYELFLILSTAFLSVSCTDSFFDLEPSSSVPTDKVYKTAEDFNVAVIVRGEKRCVSKFGRSENI